MKRIVRVEPCGEPRPVRMMGAGLRRPLRRPFENLPSLAVANKQTAEPARTVLLRFHPIPRPDPEIAVFPPTMDASNDTGRIAQLHGSAFRTNGGPTLGE